MAYKAKNVDTDKALEHIEWSRKYQDKAEQLELAKVQKYYEGVRKGLDIAEGIFTCANYEGKEEPTFEEGVLSVIYGLGKELDVPTKDLRENFSSVDEICADLADRVRERLEENEKSVE